MKELGVCSNRFTGRRIDSDDDSGKWGSNRGRYRRLGAIRIDAEPFKFCGKSADDALLNLDAGGETLFLAKAQFVFFAWSCTDICQLPASFCLLTGNGELDVQTLQLRSGCL